MTLLEIEMHTQIENPEALLTFAVCAWPNGDWCGVDMLEDALSWHSDDYVRLTVRVPDDSDDDEIEEMIDFAVWCYFTPTGDGRGPLPEEATR